MIDNKYHTERRYKGREIIIDLARIGSGYEVMTLATRTGTELAAVTTSDLSEAVQAYNKMLEDFPESTAPLTGKYAQLRDDLRAALQAGEAAAALVDDSGTCNRDAAALLLPRWNAAKVEQAAQEAGTGCFTWTLWGTKHFVFCTPHVGQAYKNEKAAEAMTAALEARGYDAFNYCQMD